MGYYPIFAEMTGRPCIIIGGGSVAERKAEGLLRVKANVTVVSPSLTELLASLVKQGKIRHIAREYCKGDLAGFGLVFVATDDPGVNAAVYQEGRERGVWVNAADDPAHCDFILPSTLRRGDLVVAVATGGASPALSRAIREELEAYFTEDYGTLAEIVGEVRRELTGRSTSPDAEAWRRALNGDLRRLIQEGKQEEARAYLLKQLGAEI
ncbi:MAG: bifunctional precorrin-2 dehydrogenase/sirohydrochlorin ferrochelatase [Deltaproteobacteria bacterium]|nr:bifunctional precorrin-2 dehydrogenase/sirohydrochlorin ferrochelatase [Deltaproteobacteria bacterium]